MKRSIYNPMAIMVLLMAVSGCSDVGSPERSAVDPSIRTLAWTPTAPSTVDTGSGVAFIPRVAVEPDGGGTAFAVWVEYVDINPFDLKPKVYHIYARRYSGGGWAGADAGSGCVAGGFNGLDDGVCLLDSGSLDYDAFGPRISMDNNGDAMVVWQQADASDCDGATVGVQTCTSVYARNYTAGGSWSAATIIDAGNTPASSPDIAMEPDPANNGGGDDGLGSAFAVWTQKVSASPVWASSNNGGNNTIRAMAEFNGKLYAAETTGTDAAPTGSQILVYDERAGTWTQSYNGTANGYEMANALYVYCSPHKTDVKDNCRLYAGMGGTAAFDGDILVFDGTTWSLVFNDSFNDTYRITDFTEMHGYLYAAGAGAPGADNGYAYWCDPTFAGTTELCDAQGDWDGDGSVAYGDSIGDVTAIIAYQSRLYFGLSAAAAGSGDIVVCEPWNGASPDHSQYDRICTDADTSGIIGPYSPGAGDPYEAIHDFAVFNGILYVATGGASGDGDILRCTPDLTNPGIGECNATANWTLSYNPAGIESVRTLGVHVGANMLFAGLGDSAGDGDIFECSPTASITVSYPFPGAGGSASDIPYAFCDTTDWTSSHDPGGAYENVRSLAKFNGYMFAGTGEGSGDGDIFLRTAYDDSQIMARRFSGGSWAVTDAASGCPVGHGTDDGRCFLDPALDDSVLPRIAMDNSGRATAAYLYHRSVDCSRSAFINNTNDVPDNQHENVDTSLLFIPCFEDRLYVDRFDGTNWLGAFDLTPIESLGIEATGAFDLTTLATNFGNTNCEDTGSTFVADGEAEAENRASPCVNIGDISVGMNSAGDATVVFKTYEWLVTTDEPGGGRANHNTYDIASNHNIRIYSRGFGQGQAWFSHNWTQNSLAAYEWTTNGSSPGTSTCGSVRALDTGTDVDGINSSNLQIMNCNLMSSVVAVEPDPADNDGASPDDALGSAMVAYERFNGTDWQVIVHRCVDTNGNGNCGDAGEWGTIADADNCANPNGSSAVGDCWDTVDNNVDSGRAPQIAMDSLGNAMLVWAEPDGAGDWRVYSRRFCPSILAGLTDCGATGWGGIATLNAPLVGEVYFEPVIAMESLNGGNANSVGDAFSLFSVLDTVLTIFRIDSSAWTP